MTAVQHHPDRLLPSSADNLICKHTGLNLPTLLNSTHPLAQPLRLIRVELVILERSLREISDTTARSIAVRRECLDAGQLGIEPVWAPPAHVLGECLGVRAGIITALKALLDCWPKDVADATAPEPDPKPEREPETKPEPELTPEETGEREKSLLYWLGSRTDTALRAQEDNQ